MSDQRDRHTATLLEDGKVLIAGGWQDTATGSLTSAELYDPVNGTFALTGSMNTTRERHTATLLPNRKVLFVGGAPIANSEVYNY